MEKDQNFNEIELKFNEIRPGTWYGKNQYPIPNASDGTVVAMGNPCKDGNKEFVTLAYYLVACLKVGMCYVFGDKFDRKFSTVW